MDQSKTFTAKQLLVYKLMPRTHTGKGAMTTWANIE